MVTGSAVELLCLKNSKTVRPEMKATAAVRTEIQGCFQADDREGQSVAWQQRASFSPLSPSSSQPKPSQPFTPQRILELLGLLLVRATSHSDVCVFEKYGVRHLNYCYFCYWCRFYVFVLLITEISNIYLPLNAATHPTPENKVL